MDQNRVSPLADHPVQCRDRQVGGLLQKLYTACILACFKLSLFTAVDLFLPNTGSYLLCPIAEVDAQYLHRAAQLADSSAGK